ncbi:MAG: hypothetical protein U0528_01510 [Anaerolineae bacterium]
MTNGRIEDWDLLSAYVDGAMRKDDREALEARLQSDPALRSLLDELRGNIDLLRRAPSLDLPREFKLDPVKYRRSAPWWARYASMQRLGMLGTAAAILLIAAGVLSGTPFLQPPSASDAGQAASSAIQQSEADSTAAAVAMQGSALPTSTDIMAFAPAPSTAATEEVARNAATGTQAGQDTTDAIALPTSTLVAAFASEGTAAAESAADAAGGAMIAPTETGTFTAIPTQTQSAANEVAPPAVAQSTMAAGYASTSPASPTSAPTGTLAPLPTQPPQASAAPTADEFAAKSAAGSPVQVPLLLVIGIPLLLLSAMLFILGWLRGRIGA